MKRPANNDNGYYNNHDNNDNNRGVNQPAEKPKRRWEKSGVSWIKREQ